MKPLPSSERKYCKGRCGTKEDHRTVAGSEEPLKSGRVSYRTRCVRCGFVALTSYNPQPEPSPPGLF